MVTDTNKKDDGISVGKSGVHRRRTDTMIHPIKGIKDYRWVFLGLITQSVGPEARHRPGLNSRILQNIRHAAPCLLNVINHDG